jgi:precorrin-3B synthase
MIALAAEPPLAGGFTRRGACPALSAPMKTGDGLLVRLNPVAGGLSPQALVGLCDAAEVHGNGLIEVTARGSVQVRGLTERSAGLFAQAVDSLGIPVRTGVPVQTSVLAGLDPDEIVDPTALAEAIRAGIADAGLDGRLGPKVSVVVDGGGRTALDEVSADVRLSAVEGGAWLVAIAGDARTARALGVAEGIRAACDVALALLSGVAAMRRAARARDLDDARLSSVANGLEGCHPMAPPSGLPAISPTRGQINPSSTAPPISNVTEGRATSPRLISPLMGEMAGRPEGGVTERDASKTLIGSFGLSNGHTAIGIALPFGSTTAKGLVTFAESAQSLGIDDIRPAPKRTLVAICDTAAQAKALEETAQTLGFITAPDDPRRALSACPGAPDCASGHLPARKIAAEIASRYSGLLDGSLHLHVSGCAKGCAHPGASDLTIVGTEGAIGLVVGGTARDEAAAFAENDAAGRAFANLADTVAAERLPGETAAQTIQRIGLSKLSEAFGRRGT